MQDIDTRLPYRIGWPSPLPILPLKTTLIEGDYRNSPEDDPELGGGVVYLEDEDLTYIKCLASMWRILDRHAVQAKSLELAFRHSLDSEPGEDSDRTLVINCKGRTGSWLHCLTDIRSCWGGKGIFKRIEFLDVDQLKAPLHCITEDDPVLQLWERDYQSKVFAIVKERNWQSIDVFRCGTASNIAECPATVLIDAYDASDATWWNDIIPNIQSQCHGWQVRLTQAYDLFRSSDNAKEPSVLRGPLGGPYGLENGSSIGPINTAAFGTLGGFIRLKLPGCDVIQFALTNHHVVRDPTLSEERKVLVSSPSIVDVDESLSAIAERIQGELEDVQNSNHPSREAEIREVKRYIEESKLLAHHIKSQAQQHGHVFSSSGVRTRDEAGCSWIMDWALVQFPSTLETSEKLRDAPMTKPAWKGREASTWSPSIRAGMRVHLKGRSSGWARGRVNGIKTTIKHRFEQDDKLVSAWAFEPGAKRGDSGSFVFVSVNGQVAGVYFGGSKGKRMGFFIPMDLIIQDIEEVTKGKVVWPQKSTME
ncbi:predicted protein [Uncinocarpus reesii 1704]|uniref:Uncharacterized protein n=1 Tax=Uncinocarpus reesii (strain UAMH 1704) TaxID=336963 RepID=C4JWE8_UNCRE|nr:uncharacterized protein UREG_06890 [Uncinocarpus reesii 1704]EEP82025.1 predicted protein [Uncinocarpus reesii 1704]